MDKLKVSYNYRHGFNNKQHNFSLLDYDFKHFSKDHLKQFLKDWVTKDWQGSGWVEFTSVLKTGLHDNVTEQIEEINHELQGFKIYFGLYVYSYDDYQIVVNDEDLYQDIVDIEVEAKSWEFDRYDNQCESFKGDVTIIFEDKEDKTFSCEHGVNDFINEYGFFINPTF